MLVRYQTIVVNAFFEEFGVIRDVVRKPITEPRLLFIAASINGHQPRLFLNNETVYLKRGDTVNIEHIEANYERGVFADIEHYGNTNDLGNDLAIFSNASILVKKDNATFGTVNIEISENGTEAIGATNGHNSVPVVERFIVDVNGFIQDIPASGTLTIVKGDVVRLIDTSPAMEIFPNAYVNLFGFWSKEQQKNTGDDRNLLINTSTDLDSKYSVREQGVEYEIRLENDSEVFSKMRLKLIEPELKHLVLKFDNGNMGYLKNGETYTFSNEHIFEIVDVKTTIPNNSSVRVKINGFVGNGVGSDMYTPIDIAMELLPEYSVDKHGRTFVVEVLYRGEQIGTAYLILSNEVYENNR